MADLPKWQRGPVCGRNGAHQLAQGNRLRLLCQDRGQPGCVRAGGNDPAPLLGTRRVQQPLDAPQLHGGRRRRSLHGPGCEEVAQGDRADRPWARPVGRRRRLLKPCASAGPQQVHAEGDLEESRQHPLVCNWIQDCLGELNRGLEVLVQEPDQPADEHHVGRRVHGDPQSRGKEVAHRPKHSLAEAFEARRLHRQGPTRWQRLDSKPASAVGVAIHSVTIVLVVAVNEGQWHLAQRQTIPNEDGDAARQPRDEAEPPLRSSGKRRLLSDSNAGLGRRHRLGGDRQHLAMRLHQPTPQRVLHLVQHIFQRALRVHP
mmetsp:Transcript_114988/g.332250  ORF Transcript_114988/g.332250 Transcript_114988/m.332250 type:complete len:316 (+) Transcript_114988:1266-2213(+)